MLPPPPRADALPAFRLDEDAHLVVTPASAPWRPRGEFASALREAAVPESLGPSACTGWRVLREGGMRSAIPCRITVVAHSPVSEAAFERRARGVVRAALRILAAADQSCAEGPLPRWWWTGQQRRGGAHEAAAAPPAAALAGKRRRGGGRGAVPASIELAVCLWRGRKRLPASGPVTTQHANTGFTWKWADGRVLILVFRAEEAIKTIAHEVLHAFDVGDWANRHPDALDAVRRWGDHLGGVRSSVAPRPAESIVDTLAIRMMWALFGERDGVEWEECVAVAAESAARASAALVAGGQDTWALEYFPVKAALMSRVGHLLSVHAAGGLGRPASRDDAARLLAPPAGQRAPPGPASRGVSLRFTPARLARA